MKEKRNWLEALREIRSTIQDNLEAWKREEENTLEQAAHHHQTQLQEQQENE